MTTEDFDLMKIVLVGICILVIPYLVSHAILKEDEDE